MVHRLDEIEVHRFDLALLDAIEGAIDRSTQLEIVRTDGRLYVTVEGKVVEGDLARVSLVEDWSGARAGSRLTASRSSPGHAAICQ